MVNSGTQSETNNIAHRHDASLFLSLSPNGRKHNHSSTIIQQMQAIGNNDSFKNVFSGKVPLKLRMFWSN